MPSRLGRYAVRRRIGSGGFATVWLAYDEQLDSPVAVKVLADNWTEDHHVRTRFQEEGRFLRRVESPHVVSVYDAGELEDGRPYLVMSYADQGTLADRLEVEGLTVGQVVEVIAQVGAGLQALHDQGVLHRDVKPANVLFRSVDPTAAEGRATEVRAMLGDHGLGKALDMSSRLTVIAGTPTFVAPEQAQGERLGPAADQYSLGALTYLLLAGRAPYSHASLSAAASPGEVPPLSTPEREFSDEVDAVVRRALDPDPEQRWPDVTAYTTALRDALGERASSGMPERWLPIDPQLTQPGARPTALPDDSPLPEPTLPRRRRRRNRVLAAVVGLLALAGGGIGGWTWASSDHPDVTLADDSGALEVTVPDEWAGYVGAAGWTPPDGETAYPALSVGSTESWTAPDDPGEGVFLGILPGTELPALMPEHPECDSAEEPVSGGGEEPSTTVVHADCPGGVTVERVVQVAANRLLWVQVRSADRATANRVLDAVETNGL
jgi:serine/threonine protein kinase